MNADKITFVAVNNKFGVLLAQKRAQEKRNISLSEVAKVTGVARRTLYAWQNNKTQRFDAPVINALSHYFELRDIGELLEYIDDPPAPKKKKASK